MSGGRPGEPLKRVPHSRQRSMSLARLSPLPRPLDPDLRAGFPAGALTLPLGVKGGNDPSSETGKHTMSEPRFPLGQIVATPGVIEEVHPADRQTCLARHAAGDWGDLDEDDRIENELSVMSGFRLLSAYHDRNGVKFWIITEADRSVTTFLLPSEY